ncbi:hypothetical protein F5876DRAFT_78238 [Lentinula aff. lateritia]|uniref:Uncharacterized protein n=1 Tax=Lentinula aff. lateritia TaxID=2804960 RepID=A0ACC1TWI4_9AGAR|nr:hypothetical protein F5876DRAFT_78238 [Lentinula aff. lateritia]
MPASHTTTTTSHNASVGSIPIDTNPPAPIRPMSLSATNEARELELKMERAQERMKKLKEKRRAEQEAKRKAEAEAASEASTSTGRVKVEITCMVNEGKGRQRAEATSGDPDDNDDDEGGEKAPSVKKEGGPSGEWLAVLESQMAQGLADVRSLREATTRTNQYLWQILRRQVDCH